MTHAGSGGAFGEPCGHYRSCSFGRRDRRNAEDDASQPPDGKGKPRNAAAALSLFRIYTDGILVPAEPERAIAWLTQSAEAGHLTALEQWLQNICPASMSMLIPRAGRNFTERLPRRAVGLQPLRSAALRSRRQDCLCRTPGRTWLQRASEAGMRQAAVLLSNLDLKLALAFQGRRRNVCG